MFYTLDIIRTHDTHHVIDSSNDTMHRKGLGPVACRYTITPFGVGIFIFTSQHLTPAAEPISSI